MAKAKRIFCVIAYDINNDRKRNRVAKILESYGARVNFSVFECMLTASQLQKAKEKIAKHIEEETDTVVYYQICVNCFTKTVYDPERRKIYDKVQII